LTQLSGRRTVVNAASTVNKKAPGSDPGAFFVVAPATSVEQGVGVRLQSNRASVIEMEPAAPKPPRPAVEAVVSRPEATKKPEAVRQADQSPFFGGLPDDPGVRHTRLEPEPKTRLRLF